MLLHKQYGDFVVQRTIYYPSGVLKLYIIKSSIEYA